MKTQMIKGGGDFEKILLKILEGKKPARNEILTWGLHNRLGKLC